MKALVPVAGMGTRLRPHTHTNPKALITVAGKPILGHILDHVVGLGIQDLVLVVGHMGDRIEAYVREHYGKRCRLAFVEQAERQGLGHAVWLAREAVGDDEIFIILGDTIFEGDLRPMLEGTDSVLGVKEVDDPSRFGVAVRDENGVVTRLVEKPDYPVSRLALVGIYRVPRAALLMRCLDDLIRTNRRTRGEFQLTDALQAMIDQGETMRTLPIDDWYDCGNPDTLLLTNRKLLTEMHTQREVQGSILIPPVFVAEGARVEHSVVGPYVSLASGVVVRESVIRDTIVNEGALVEQSLLRDSLIGDRAVVRGTYLKLNVGDSSEIDWS